MWLTELGHLYTEGWTPGSPNLPGTARGAVRAQETPDSLRMKGTFGSGDSPPNMAAQSMASGQNPYEQEEEATLSKSNVLNLIDASMADLDHRNNSDKTALLILGTLRKKIKSL